MKRFFSAFTNWKTPNIRQLLKEYKIEGEMKGNAFWKNKRSFVDAVKNAKVESITPEADKAIAYRSRTKDKGQLMGMIKGYRSYPQFRNEATVDAIYNGYKSNAPMDRPLVVDFGGGKRRVFSGNTRMDAAFHSGINPEVLVVNAHKNFSAKLKEFKMVRPAKILRSPEKFSRAAAVKAIRRHLEKLPGVDKNAVRSAFGAKPLPGEITTKKQVKSYINWAKKNGGNIDPNFTKSGYLDRSALPKLATINGRPSLLAYRGIDSGGAFEQVKRKLSRPREGWNSASSRNPVSQVRNRSGGIKSQPQHPNGTAMSLSTSNKVPLDFMKGDLSGEATMGVYGLDANQLIKAVRENKPTAKVGLVNSKFPAEREVTQINGGNLLAVRKYKGMKINETASSAPRERLRRAFESKLGGLKEFRSYAKTGQEERSDFLKAGLIGTGLAAAGGLAGLGLYKAGVSGAANKAAHLEKVMTRWRGMRQASAGASAKKAASSLDASVNAQKLRATRITANIEAKKVADRAAKAAAKTPKTTATPVAVNPVAADPIIITRRNGGVYAEHAKQPAAAAATPVANVVPVVETPAKTTAVVGKPKRNAVERAAQLEVRKKDAARSARLRSAETSTPAVPASPNTKPVTAADIADSQEESNLTKTSEELRAAIKKQKETDASKTKGANKKASKASPTPETSTTNRVKVAPKADSPKKGASKKGYVRAGSNGTGAPIESLINNPSSRVEEIKAALGRVKAREAAAAKSPAKSPAPVAQDYSTPPETVAQERARQKARRDAKKKRLAKNAGATTKETSSAKTKKTYSAYLRNIRYFDQFQADEAGIPLTGRVAHDRFVKKIRDEDLDRRDANLLRAGLAGGAAGALFRGKLGVGKRALIGAGLGGLGVLGVRQITRNDRDIYGERNRSSKRAELIPAVGGLGAAAWLAGKRLKAFAKKFNHGGHGEHGVKEFVRGFYSAKLLPSERWVKRADPRGWVQSEVLPAPDKHSAYSKYVADKMRAMRRLNSGNIPYTQRAKKPEWLSGAQAQLPSYYFSYRLRGLKNFDDYRLYYFKGRNTGIAARSAEEARAKKKRGGDELVAVRTPNETERSQMSRGIWVRTRRDGKSPDQSKYGKGRGQGPARKSLQSLLAGAKYFAEKKKRELNPYVGAALSGGASGAVLGGLSIFKHGVSPLSALKSAGIAGLASAGIVGGGALIGSKLIGRPRSDESAPYSKRAAIGGALAGSGAGLLGAIVLKKTPMGRRWVNKWDSGKGLMGRPASWIKGSNLPGAMALGGLGGGLIGGVQGADEGQQVDSIRNLKKDMKKFSRKEFTHSAIALKKAWKTDPKLKEDFLKRVAASVRNSVAANQKQVKMFGYNTQPRNKDTMAFTGPIKGWVTGEDLVNSDGSKWQASSPQLINAMMREAKNKRVVVQRGGRLTGDVAAVLQGRDRERDASGRIKKREWEKSWFQNKATEAGLAVGGLGAAAAARYGHNNPDTAIGKAYWNSRKSAASTSADLKKVGGKILTSINKITGKRFSSKLARLRELDAVANYAGWDVRDPRGKSARVFAPGSQKRERRPKEWHEKAENERKLWKAKVAAAALGGAGVALIGSRIISGKSLVPKFGGGGGFKVPSHAPSAAEAEAILNKFKNKGK